MCFPEVISLCMKNWFQRFFCISVFYEWQALQFLFLLKSFQNFPYNIFMYTSHVVLHLFWLFVRCQWYKLVLEKETQTLFFLMLILPFTLISRIPAMANFLLYLVLSVYAILGILNAFSLVFFVFSHQLNITFSDLYYYHCIF